MSGVNYCSQLQQQQQQPQQQQPQAAQVAQPQQQPQQQPAQQVVAGIHAATPENAMVGQQQPQPQQQQPQQLAWPAALQGVDGINAATSGDPWAPWALVDQMPEPTPAMVQELGNFIESLKFPAFDF